MRFVETGIEGAVLVVPEPIADDRGAFARVFDDDAFRARGLETSFVQANLATTTHAGTVRGLHYQLPPAAEAKLIRCTSGAVFDVAVDLRPTSPTFRRWIGVELDARDGVALYVPPLCAHGYQALRDGSRVLYQVGAAYSPDLERGIHHADPALDIAWPLPPRHISAKDRGLPPFDHADLPRPAEDRP